MHDMWIRHQIEISKSPICSQIAFDRQYFRLVLPLSFYVTHTKKLKSIHVHLSPPSKLNSKSPIYSHIAFDCHPLLVYTVYTSTTYFPYGILFLWDIQLTLDW